MKLIIAPSVAVLVVSAWAFAQTPSPEQQVQQISGKMLQSYLQSSDLVTKYIADDALFMDNSEDNDIIVRKAQIKHDLSRPRSKGSEAARDMVKNVRVAEVQVEGNTAVSVTRAWLSDGKNLNAVFTIILTFARRDGEWRIISAVQNKR